MEEGLARGGIAPVAGVDEAGRGCLAGPVVAAAVIPDPRRRLPGVDDSKELSPEQRRLLAHRIRETALSWSVAVVPAHTIDRENILRATRRAMCEALAGLGVRPRVAIIDAVALADAGVPCLALVKGDRLSYAVAAASILAKTERDLMMVELDRRYPHYGFAQHKGYGSASHREALAAYGPSPEHRLSFRGVVPR